MKRLARLVCSPRVAPASLRDVSRQRRAHGVFAGSGPTQTRPSSGSSRRAARSSPLPSSRGRRLHRRAGRTLYASTRRPQRKVELQSRMPIASSRPWWATPYLVSSAGRSSPRRFERATEMGSRWSSRKSSRRRTPWPPVRGADDSGWLGRFISSPPSWTGRSTSAAGTGSYARREDRAPAVEVRTKDVVTPLGVADGRLRRELDSMLYAIDAKSGQRSGPSNPARTTSSTTQVGFQGLPRGGRDCTSGAATATSTRSTRRRTEEVGLSDEQVRGHRTPAVRDGVVYAGTSDSSRFMGSTRRRGASEHFDAKAYMFSSPALAGDIAYVGDHNGALRDRREEMEARLGVPDDGSKADPLKILNADGGINRDAITPISAIRGHVMDAYGS